MHLLFITFTAATAMVITLLMFAPIINRVRHKKLQITSTEDTLKHQKLIPFGGIAVFSGLLAAVSFSLFIFSYTGMLFVFVAVIVQFLSGSYYELKNNSKWNNIIIAAIVSIILVFAADIRITQFHNVFGLNRISDFISYPLSIVFIITIILAYSYATGLDDLFKGFGIVACLSFGLWFYSAHLMNWACLAFALGGSLLAFYLYNIFSIKRKMILGETGMQILGLFIAIMAIKTNEFDTSNSFQPAWVSNPVFVFSIIGIPMIEICRIFILRLISKISTFNSDPTNIYYEVYRVTGNHTETTALLILFCAVMIISTVVFNVSEIHVYYQLIVLLVEIFLLYTFTFSYFRKKYRKLRRSLV